MTADAGYWSEVNAELCAVQGIDAYIATGRLAHGQPPATETRTDAQGRRCESSDGPQAEKQGWIKDLRPTQGDRGAGERPDQGRQRPAALPVAGTGEGGCGMAPDRRDAQPAQAVQIQAMPAAGACIGKWMKGLMAAIRAESPTGTH